MGLIEKQIRKGANQRRAAPVVTCTSLSQAEVIGAIQAFADDWNGRVDARIETGEAKRTKPRKFTRDPIPALVHYHIEFAETAVMVSYQLPPHLIQEVDKRKQNPNHKWWLASVTFPRHVPGLQEGQIAVQLSLIKWLVNSKDGKMKNLQRYEAFSDGLAVALRGERAPVSADKSEDEDEGPG
jgi:hypothetical protein